MCSVHTHVEYHFATLRILATKEQIRGMSTHSSMRTAWAGCAVPWTLKASIILAWVIILSSMLGFCKLSFIGAQLFCLLVYLAYWGTTLNAGSSNPPNWVLKISKLRLWSLKWKIKRCHDWTLTKIQIISWSDTCSACQTTVEWGSMRHPSEDPRTEWLLWEKRTSANSQGSMSY